MMNDPGDILLRRYLEGSCTQAEEEQIEAWLQQDSSHADRLEQFAIRNAGSSTGNIDEGHIKATLLQKIDDRTPDATADSSISSLPNTYLHKKDKYQWVATAAVILLTLSASVGIYVWQSHFLDQEITYVERTMPAGKTAILTLSDGSKVHLNSESTLRFPEKFGTASRKIFLEGEAFFEVAPDEERPFKVHAGNLKTTVLGTAFNIKAFPGEQDVKVAVEHGKVSVEKGQADSPDAMLLTRNQWAAFDKKSQKFTKESGDIRRLISWRDGVLYFHNKTVAEIVATLERWYGTEISIENEAIKSCVLHGEQQEESLENVLEAMQFALDVDYKSTEGGIIITGGRCK
ncbi:FecR domain-containing protein [Fodinibius salsisoli]|uniref:FecR domain-containing protein n=1 Tax=Fodinibius salsisoli TaxID=2820877 RepID=A0ABT3PP89_9BACT|nr:FecR domain-containing protein [Fodinibius salsisoli]MCW9707684.1 FecR domain-containing protein [Fodinibius salsisoli]